MLLSQPLLVTKLFWPLYNKEPLKELELMIYTTDKRTNQHIVANDRSINIIHYSDGSMKKS